MFHFGPEFYLDAKRQISETGLSILCLRGLLI